MMMMMMMGDDGRKYKGIKKENRNITNSIHETNRDGKAYFLRGHKRRNSGRMRRKEKKRK